MARTSCRCALDESHVYLPSPVRFFFLSSWRPRHPVRTGKLHRGVFLLRNGPNDRGMTSGSEYKTTLRTCDFKLPIQVAVIRLSVVSSALKLTNTEAQGGQMRRRAKHERGSSELRLRGCEMNNAKKELRGALLRRGLPTDDGQPRCKRLLHT
jgi:hypothetical protein